MITIQSLIAAGVGPTQARLFAGPLSNACERFGINTYVRKAAFIAQAGHESGDFAHVEENLYYTTAERVRSIWPTRVHSLGEAATLLRNPQALANRVYSGRNGNGDESSGEGWKYRGRGLIQLTGWANYLAAEAAIDQPYKAQPDLVLLPAHACMTAAWFFVAGGCLPLADASNTEGITKVINGAAMAGLNDRRQRFERALRAIAEAN